ncbi:unnamed protein product [Urochloa decumbens]|uniref:Uncharacterized protein n=1 Tax=Urochloa decumbens TaxID=240449 RepID=A0ABC8ZA09_9POAL
MGFQSSPVLLLHLRRLNRFLKRQGLHSAARTLERESLVYFDAAHLQRLVRSGRWEAAGTYLRRFSPLWEGEDGTSQHYTSFLHTVQHHAMLHYLACRGEEGGRDASSLFCNSNDAAFRSKFPEIAQRHDLYRSMASKQARASVDWEAIKLTTLEKLQELLRLSPDLERSLRMREPQCTSTPSEIIPLDLPGSQKHQRKRVGSKPARELALSFQQKRLSTSQETGHSGGSGRKRLRAQDDYCNGIARKPFDPTKCFKRPRMAGDVGEPREISA